jgi:protein-S-isoprenylcysteine O-methyltransferase Ste14
VGLLVKNLLFTGLVPGTVAGLLPWLIVSDGEAGGALALPLFVVGLGIYTWCVWDFASFGRGTPAPIDAPRRLVVRGLYRHSRNPMYVGVLCVILGWAALFSHAGLLLYAALVFTAFQCFIVAYEEPHLAETFGADYEAYRARVGRWLPRRPRESP